MTPTQSVGRFARLTVINDRGPDPRGPEQKWTRG
jgi:hypothetical protein